MKFAPNFKIASLAVLAAIVLSSCALPIRPVTPASNAAPAAPAAPAANGTDPIVIGVSGPLTGPAAQYGADWKKGFDLAIEEINAKGGIKGRKLQYVFEDTQADPKQSVVIAQKFVADPKIVVELGDFASGASMAASPIYQRAGLVQFGFTNSHPNFTKGGDYMWSTSVTQADASPVLADFAAKELGLKKVAVLHQNSDWGKSSAELFNAHAKEIGLEVVATEGYLTDEKDFKSTLTRVKSAQPEGLVLFSYETDGALIAQQLAQTDLKVPIVGGASLHSPDYLKLGGDAVNGSYILAEFDPNDTRPEVVQFVKAYKAKYGADAEPEFFAAHAYDAMKVVAAAIEAGGADRTGIRNALATLKDVPSVIYGTITFNPETRRVAKPFYVSMQVKDGKFAVWKK